MLLGRLTIPTKRIGRPPITNKGMEVEQEKQLRNLRNAVRKLANYIQELARNEGKSNYIANECLKQIEETLNHD